MSSLNAYILPVNVGNPDYPFNLRMSVDLQTSASTLETQLL